MNKKQERIGLFLGSFNPIHNGHLIIADYIFQEYNFDKIWFIISPCNPLKNDTALLNDNIRLHLVELAIKNDERFIACDIEFTLSKPSYTINTLNALKEKFFDKEFILIIGEDNLECFEKWRDYEKILNEYKVMVYPRLGSIHNKTLNHNNIIRINAPIIEISSTKIRNNIEQNKSIRYLLPNEVRAEIEKNNYYCNSKRYISY